MGKDGPGGGAGPVPGGGEREATSGGWGMSNQEPVGRLVEHFFRHEAGRLVAVLTRFFGWRNFDLVEDMVQATLLEALQSWRVRGVPDNPSAWVHRVARNKVLEIGRASCRARGWMWAGS